jgi:outer membrane immunogenic protein
MNIKSIMTATAIAIAPLAATAGNINEPLIPTIVPVVQTAPASMDWSGAYVGFGYGSATGDIDFVPTPDRALDDGTIASLFGGYQIQRGALVYGGELAINSVDGSDLTGFAGLAEISEMMDIKGRVGYAAGSFLVYGVLGYSVGTYDNDIPAGDDEWDISGQNYGIGVDYAFTSNFIVGAEYLVRDVEGDNPAGGGQTIEVDYDSISFRVAYKF